MERLKLFKGRGEYKIRLNELINRHLLNVQRARTHFETSIVDQSTEKIVMEGEKIFIDVGYSLRDIAWQTALNREGIDDNTQKRLWNSMRNASDDLRDILRGEKKG